MSLSYNSRLAGGGMGAPDYTYEDFLDATNTDLPRYYVTEPGAFWAGHGLGDWTGATIDWLDVWRPIFDVPTIGAPAGNPALSLTVGFGSETTLKAGGSLAIYYVDYPETIPSEFQIWDWPNAPVWWAPGALACAPVHGPIVGTKYLTLPLLSPQLVHRDGSTKFMVKAVSEEGDLYWDKDQWGQAIWSAYQDEHQYDFRTYVDITGWVAGSGGRKITILNPGPAKSQSGIHGVGRNAR